MSLDRGVSILKLSLEYKVQTLTVLFLFFFYNYIVFTFPVETKLQTQTWYRDLEPTFPHRAHFIARMSLLPFQPTSSLLSWPRLFLAFYPECRICKSFEGGPQHMCASFESDCLGQVAPLFPGLGSFPWRLANRNYLSNS